MINPEIISKAKVSKARSGDLCHLRRKVIKIIDDPLLKKRTYYTETWRCNYYEIDVPVLDNEENVVFAEDGVTVVTEKKLKLQDVEKRDHTSSFDVSYKQADALAAAINPMLPDSLSETDKNLFQVRQGLLMDSSNPDNRYVTTNWEFLTEENRIKDIE